MTWHDVDHLLVVVAVVALQLQIHLEGKRLDRETLSRQRQVNGVVKLVAAQGRRLGDHIRSGGA